MLKKCSQQNPPACPTATVMIGFVLEWKYLGRRAYPRSLIMAAMSLGNRRLCDISKAITYITYIN